MRFYGDFLFIQQLNYYCHCVATHEHYNHYNISFIEQERPTDLSNQKLCIHILFCFLK